MAKQADYVRYTIRVPADLYASLQEGAGEKSVNAEIVARLERYNALPKIISDYEQAEKDLFEARVKVMSLQAELEATQNALTDQKKVSAMLQQLLKESADEAKQDHEDRQAAGAAIERKYNDMVEQRTLLEGLKEELAHLSHARDDSEGETARLVRQQADSLKNLERRIDQLTKGLVVFGRAFELSTDGDQKRATDILDKAIDEVEVQGREQAPDEQKAG